MPPPCLCYPCHAPDEHHLGSVPHRFSIPDFLSAAGERCGGGRTLKRQNSGLAQSLDALLLCFLLIIMLESHVVNIEICTGTSDRYKESSTSKTVIVVLILDTNGDIHNDVNSRANEDDTDALLMVILTVSIRTAMLSLIMMIMTTTTTTTATATVITRIMMIMTIIIIIIMIIIT